MTDAEKIITIAWQVTAVGTTTGMLAVEIGRELVATTAIEPAMRDKLWDALKELQRVCIAMGPLAETLRQSIGSTRMN